LRAGSVLEAIPAGTKKHDKSSEIGYPQSSLECPVKFGFVLLPGGQFDPV
jgi:hypothetical protein